MGRLVLGFDGERQRLNRAQVLVRHFLGMKFSVFELADVEAIRSIDNINDRKSKQSGLPSDLAIEIAHKAGDGGSD